MLYATPADLFRLGLPEAALEGVARAALVAALGAASRKAEGYLRQRYALPLVWSFLPEAERSTSGTGPTIDTRRTDGSPALSLALDVPRIDDGAALTLAIDDSADGASFTEAAAFSPFEAPGRAFLEAPARRYVRARWTLTGGAALFGVSWDADDLKGAVCALAAWDLLTTRGYAPDSKDEAIARRHDAALVWLQKVARAEVSPLLLDTTPGEQEGGFFSRSRRSRGWR